MTTRELGDALAAARRDGRYADIDWSSVTDTASAMAVQAAAVAAYGGRQIGYKIGATSQAAQAIVGTDRPFYGPMAANDACYDGDTVPWKDHYRGVECEFAFTMARDYPAPGETIDRQSLEVAIADCLIALEVVGRRTAGDGMPQFPGIIADFAAHSAFVAGPGVANWTEIDLAAVSVRGSIDGDVTNEGFGAAVLGHPLNALAWLAEALVADGSRLKAGDIVSTGTTLGIVIPQPGAAIAGDFGELGTVSLTFEGP
ncbi:MAG TPA: fumarylacetoacetate hydrolase family protein [Afifellaceae bacterium]|nr:fumarylacetoacetate hydrolase family protein [Afifellaceae bacterium]